MDYKICWITLNRACNLRCKWCYARSTGFDIRDNMPLSMAFQILDICENLGIKSVTLIGGEPTLYPNLFDVISYANSKQIKAGFVTNGIRLSDEKFLDDLISVGIHGFSISLKGEDEKTFQNISGVNAFGEVVKGIKNCVSRGKTVSVSMVLTEDNVNTFMNGVAKMKEAGARQFHFSFCYEFDMSAAKGAYLKKHNPKKLLDSFAKIYPSLDTLTEHRFTLESTYPTCLWNQDVFRQMVAKGQVMTICQLLAKTGLIFDPSGYLIPCNAMPEIKLGRLNEDFKTGPELIEYSETPDFIDAYKHFCGVPSKKCLECGELEHCGGGCVCQWTNYSFEELLGQNDSF